MNAPQRRLAGGGWHRGIPFKGSDENVSDYAAFSIWIYYKPPANEAAVMVAN